MPTRLSDHIAPKRDRNEPYSPQGDESEHQTPLPYLTIYEQQDPRLLREVGDLRVAILTN